MSHQRTGQKCTGKKSATRITVATLLLILTIFDGVVEAQIKTNQSDSEKNVTKATEIENEIFGKVQSTKINVNKRDLPQLQSIALNILKPVPVVDTIKEEEIYGNTGDRFITIGRGIVGGVETLSNLINSALNFPLDAVKKVSRSATEALNNLGGRLVGLQ